MKYWKKIGCICMVAIMILGVAGITGCGQKEQNEEAGEKKEESYIDPENVEVREDNPLTGKKIAYLGSSVMEGTENNNVSYVEYIAKRNEGTYIKETKEDSTMADTGEDSYIPRMLNMDKDADMDLFFVEIAFADVQQGIELGEISESMNAEDFDTKTTIGALEYICSYVEQTWGCPVVFITNPRFSGGIADEYAKMVEQVWYLREKWKTGLVCQWFKLGGKEDSYMVDDTHPSGIGYLEWMTPNIEENLLQVLINSNPEYALENVAENEPNILTGKHIVYLGSSVTLGTGSNYLSFADYIAKRNQTTYVKEAVGGTTLVTSGPTSYIPRMENNIDPEQKVDLFVCQLSTNDAGGNKPLGEISDTKDMASFDTTTIIGAMEYIICYAQQTWNCPVMFYTGTRYESELYPQMVEALKQLAEKYDIGIINLWDGLDVNIPEYEEYMTDTVHPNRAGYLKWWTPFMEQSMIEFLSERQ